MKVRRVPKEKKVKKALKVKKDRRVPRVIKDNVVLKETKEAKAQACFLWATLITLDRRF